MRTAQTRTETRSRRRERAQHEAHDGVDEREPDRALYRRSPIEDGKGEPELLQGRSSVPRKSRGRPGTRGGDRGAAVGAFRRGHRAECTASYSLRLALIIINVGGGPTDDSAFRARLRRSDHDDLLA